MERLTRHMDEYSCRIKNCSAENWVENLTGLSIYNWKSDRNICDECPFEEHINRLAEFEDETERMEDDLK